MSRIPSWGLKYSSADAMWYFQGWLNPEAVKYGGRQVSSIYVNHFVNHADTSTMSFRLMAFPSAYLQYEVLYAFAQIIA